MKGVTEKGMEKGGMWGKWEGEKEKKNDRKEKCMKDEEAEWMTN